MDKAVRSHKNSELSMLFNEKFTENGDTAYISTGNHLIDLLFQAEYYQKHLNEVKIGDSHLEQLFSMFMRDPRNGMKYRNLGRVLMRLSDIPGEWVAAVGRYDDLWESPIFKDFKSEWIDFLFEQCANGNQLAKKWMPHYVAKTNGKPAQSTITASKFRRMLGMNKQEYGKFVKCDTVESKLSAHQNDLIEFDKVPTLALLKYWRRFAGTCDSGKNDMAERFAAYLESVRKGEKKMNFSTATVYDIYRNRENIDADLAFDQMEKISGNWIPIVDTSFSMLDEDALGKALAIGHYLGKTSTYCPNHVLTFSSKPTLIELGVTQPRVIYSYHETDRAISGNGQYCKEIASMYTGDWSNTNFGAVMDILGGLETEFPEYLVVLSDMEFDRDSQGKNIALMNSWREKGIRTKLVWWNLNARHRTTTETIRRDENGSIFMSGYDPIMLKFLGDGFDGETFLSKLLTEYAKTLPQNIKNILINPESV